jgi:hydrogenase maturation protein HypF
VQGVVQGVGFRPHVHRLATRHGLAGTVLNDGGGVVIEVEGDIAALEAFADALVAEAPSLARISAVDAEPAPLTGATGFHIVESVPTGATALIPPDVATCTDCLRELFDPADRRYRYPFVNCTACGPRFTIVTGVPYDRPLTTMAGFPLCEACRAEYEDPGDRRFHAEPIACPDCGPRLTVPLEDAVAVLRGGGIVAVKGLGGYHLACDATNAEAVARLRLRKQREEKPFALMLANAASIAPYAEVAGKVGAGAAALLESPERPIVLLCKRRDCDALLPGIAPGLAWLGVMLPYTPLHWLLFHEAAGRPAGTAWMAQAMPLALVMTSANPGGEPIARDDDEALARLGGIADAWLAHDRDIVARCDDSVVRMAGASDGMPQFLRRSRGWTPRAIRLAKSGPSVLAVGAHLKNTACVTRGNEAFLSQHIGDLDTAPACAMLEETVVRLLELLDVAPAVVAHDLHPDFFGSRFAAAFAAKHGLPLLGVQHHHAHIAAVAAEHGIEGPLLGLALDGVGYGSEGGRDEPPRSLGSPPPQGADAGLGRSGAGIWGGELLRVDGAACERVGHLRELPLPGGDRAAREPWRMAAAALHLMGRGQEIERRFPERPAPALRQMLEQGINSPPTSSCGRWFDAAAGLLGVREVAAYEGQAAMLLEGLAEAHATVAPWRGGWRIAADGTLDLLPLLERLAADGTADRGRGAALFHATLAQGLAQWVLRAAEGSGTGRVALGGGCFLNRVLAAGLRRELEAAGMDVLEARQVPPNDGGIALGQAWVAMNGER